ncbi:TonB-dependent siderophore receptor [Rhizobium sp. CG5]|uniref:TonB-dependent siderophore receptor n=1 Tax=Rhizobium sp. CG5 TaxID=2726076 RepID=UPI00203379BD|nr:TonB-dependent siderophore receptor [Rhizobium sp. CG5]MCM2476487.1 TonB-dependent siderophore receptor [Rhizobium sp. CG5]
MSGLIAANVSLAEEVTVLQKITVEADGATDGEDAKFVAKGARSATKTATPLVSTPQSVSVVTKKQFEEQGARSAAEALRYSAGVTPDIRPNDRFDIVPLRGFGGYQSFVQYLDGLRLLRGMSFSQPTVDVFDLERIEVIRGPSSVLYGQMTPGGLVNMVSKKPTEEVVREVDLTVGADNYIKAGIDLGGPVAGSDTLFYRFVASGRYNETNIDGVTTERISISPSLMIKPEEGTSLTLLFNHTNDPSSSYPSYLPAAGTVYANGTYADVPYDFNVGDPDYDMFTRQTTRAGYEFEHEFGENFTYRQNLRYTHVESEQRGLTGYAISGTTISRRTSHVTEDVDTFVIDNQLETDFETGVLDHTLLAGFDYQYTNANRLYGTGTGPSIDYLNPVYGTAIATPAYQTDTTQVTNQTGIYLQDQIEIGKLNLAFGGRYDSYSIDTDTTTLSTSTTATTTQENHAFTGRAGAAYLFDNGLAPYVSYSTSFEPPSGLAYSDAGGVTLEPVTGEQLEVGVKYQPEGFDALFMASLYHLTQQNVVSSDTAHSGYYVQTGEVETTGLELEAKVALGGGWDMTAAYTYLDSEVTKSATAANVGKVPVAVPQHSGSLWVHYGIDHGTFEGLGFGAGARYTGTTYGADDNSFKVGSFMLFDASLNYDFGARSSDLAGLSLNVSVSNIFNKEYVSSCITTINCFYGTGRAAYATLKYKW